MSEDDEIILNNNYRNIQYKPQIWGLSYTGLFSSLGMFFLGMMLFKGIGLLIGIVIGLIMGSVCYVSFKYKEAVLDHQANSKNAKYIKNFLSSNQVSNCKIKIINKNKKGK